MASIAGARLGKIVEIAGRYSSVAPLARAYIMVAAANPTPIEEWMVQETYSASVTSQVLPYFFLTFFLRLAIEHVLCLLILDLRAKCLLELPNHV